MKSRMSLTDNSSATVNVFKKTASIGPQEFMFSCKANLNIFYLVIELGSSILDVTFFQAEILHLSLLYGGQNCSPIPSALRDGTAALSAQSLQHKILQSQVVGDTWTLWDPGEQLPVRAGNTDLTEPIVWLDARLLH